MLGYEIIYEHELRDYRGPKKAAALREFRQEIDRRHSLVTWWTIMLTIGIVAYTLAAMTQKYA